MGLFVTERVVRDLAGRLLESPVEDMARNTVPIKANPEVGTEGVFELPPVEDPEYTPGTVVDLSKAAYALAKMVPSEDVTRFWKKLRRLSQEMEEQQEGEFMKTEDTVQLENLRTKIRQIFLEAGEGEFGRLHRPGKVTSWDEKDPRYEKTRITDDFDEPIPEPEDAPGEVGERGREATWEEIAAQMGYSTPSAAKQFVDDPGRLTDKVRFLMNMLMNNPKKFEMLRLSAVEQYVDTLLASDAIDKEDADFLRSHPDETARLESYRNFLGKFIQKAMMADPEASAQIAKTKQDRADIRVANKARKAAKKGG